MKIKLAVNATILLSPLTGIGQYVYQLMKQLEKGEDIEPYYFYTASWDNSLRNSALPGIKNIKNILSTLLPNPFALRRFIGQAVFSHGAKKNNIQLYHDPSFIPYRFDGPTVITVHDLSHIYFPETHPSKRVAILNKLLPIAIEQADYIIVDSEFIKNQVITLFGTNPDKVAAIHLGVSDQFQPMLSEQTFTCLSGYGLVHGKYLLAVGTIEPRKNLIQVLKAYKRLPENLRKEYPLVIAGSSGWLADSMENEMRSLISKGQARLLGYVPSEMLPALYAGATTLLYTSLYEGFGLPPLEAMASGIPVITSNQASIPEVVGNAGIMVEPHDIATLKQVIVNLIEDPDDAKLRVQLGIERAKQFSWEKCASETLKVYRKAYLV